MPIFYQPWFRKHSLHIACFVRIYNTNFAMYAYIYDFILVLWPFTVSILNEVFWSEILSCLLMTVLSFLSYEHGYVWLNVSSQMEMKIILAHRYFELNVISSVQPNLLFGSFSVYSGDVLSRRKWILFLAHFWIQVLRTLWLLSYCVGLYGCIIAFCIMGYVP